MKVTELILIRHGESEWNKENRFTGWTDINLSYKGRKEAISAGKLFKKKGFIFNYAYTSFLKRAIHTLWYILDQIDQQWIPCEKNWRLNERHYGALQGLNKTEIAKKYGDNQVKLWRRSFKITPPALTIDDFRYPGHDIRYSNLKPTEIPVTESLANTITRVVPFWETVIKPRIAKNEKIIIVAHGNSLRALITHLNKMTEEEIIELNIPTAMPIVYEFDKNIQPINNFYLI
ncbi:2,3-bisphosphoglycerate-dependent phosphoglycerate mutase [Candidatus Arsenophonus lipoptenae]|uniref:2,3-bisphosphoglycerate-dependent phosphoglycerate mutase n=1 Tax=Candidatus Arsenophonus lipoptenae TaxID=634113 RepID=A0A0X9VY78_9GAMM|nr:2,3-diphosphoglycerate-dependent phosphoglycerate mutase [Candidatus Arsenophonus lipoptenae]AMA64625.1 2,3-bisphosphoglycerate-dependent phosphoglycerate mutase [Candidatus Arsenophonus lipoptenae]